MPRHDVSLKIAHEINIGNVDVELPVRVDDKLLGTLTISKGGIDWRPTRSRARKSLGWLHFSDVMAKEGQDWSKD